MEDQELELVQELQQLTFSLSQIAAAEEIQLPGDATSDAASSTPEHMQHSRSTAYSDPIAHRRHRHAQGMPFQDLLSYTGAFSCEDRQASSSQHAPVPPQQRRSIDSPTSSPRLEGQAARAACASQNRLPFTHTAQSALQNQRTSSSPAAQQPVAASGQPQRLLSAQAHDAVAAASAAVAAAMQGIGGSPGRQQVSAVSSRATPLAATAQPPLPLPAPAGSCITQQDIEQQGLVQQLLQQHNKLLDLVQTMATTVKTSTERASGWEKQAVTQTISDANASAAAASPVAPAAAPAAEAAVSGALVDAASYKALQDQYELQLADHHQLKKRFTKVQKVLLQHLQQMRLQAAAADAARDEAKRREQEAAATAAALQQQLIQQQQDLQRGQHELCCLRDQLEQVKELHKRKLQQVKQDMQRQYDAQLQATTAAYAHELAQIQAHLASRRSGSRNSCTNRSHAALQAAVAAAGQLSGENGVQLTAAAATAAAAEGSAVIQLTQQQQQQLQRRSSIRNKAAANASAAAANSSPGGAGCAGSAAAAAARVHSTASEGQHSDAAGLQAAQQSSRQQAAGISAFANHQQQLQPQCAQQQVPAEVLHYAERYQKGGEGSCRPATAAPSVLQQQRQREQPVPEVAAQLAQHFVAGGEGISRPRTAPSSDRCGLLPHRSCSPPRSGRPSVRNSSELPLATAGTSATDSQEMPAFIVASNELWDALCE